MAPLKFWCLIGYKLFILSIFVYNRQCISCVYILSPQSAMTASILSIPTHVHWTCCYLVVDNYAFVSLQLEVSGFFLRTLGQRRQEN